MAFFIIILALLVFAVAITIKVLDVKGVPVSGINVPNTKELEKLL